MSAEKLSLEILIKTIADAQGIKTTSDGIKQVAKEFESAAQAGKPLELTADTIKQKLADVGKGAGEAGAGIDTFGKTSNEVFLALEEKLRADIKAQEALGKSADDLKAKLAETYKTRTEGLENSLSQVTSKCREAANTAGTLTQQCGQLKTASAGASQVMNGLSQGGIGGLVIAGRGLITTITALAGSAIGAVLIPALAVAGAAFFAFSKIIDSNRSTIDKWAAESRARSDAVKAALAEINAAADKSLESQIQKVQKLTESYSELTNAIERSRARTDALGEAETARRLAEIDAREAEAMEKAKTPEAQAGVQKKFAADRELVRNEATDRGISDKKTGAEVEKLGAENAIKEAQTIIDAAKAAADEAARAFADAVEQIRQFKAGGGDPTSKFGQALVDDGKVKQGALNAANNNLEAIQKEKAAVLKAAAAKVEDAELAIKLADIAREKFEAEKRTLAAARRVADAKEAEARIAEQVAKGVSEPVARAREKANTGGTAVDRNGNARVIDPGSNATPQEKAAAEAINASKTPAPLQVTPTFAIPDAGATREKSSARQTLSQSDNFSGSTAAQEQNVSAIKEAAQAIATTEAPAALDISPIKDGFGTYHQANVAAHQESKTAIGTQGQQIADLAKELAALKITVRNQADLAQASA